MPESSSQSPATFFAPLPRPVEPGLYVVATPIGNLRDITLRALDVLRACDVVLCEDTRMAAKLLSAFDLKKPLLRYDDHAGPRVLPEVVERLKAGQVVAQISDAGTPLISDPGFRLVQTAVGEAIKVHPIPGASSVLAALCVAGLPTDRFMFAGFAPNKSSARKTFFAEVQTAAATLVFFESGPRLKDSLSDMLEVFGDREAAVCRELTKLYETCIRGPLSALGTNPALDAPKGEIVIVVAPPLELAPEAQDLDAAILDALESQSVSEAAQSLAKLYNLPRKAVYQRALELKAQKV